MTERQTRRRQRTTDPLTKLIRTTEGVVLFAFNAASITLAAVNDISPSTAVKYTAIFNAIAFASRQALKAAAVLAPGAGLDPNVIPSLPEPRLAPESRAAPGFRPAPVPARRAPGREDSLAPWSPPADTSPVAGAIRTPEAAAGDPGGVDPADVLSVTDTEEFADIPTPEEER